MVILPASTDRKSRQHCKSMSHDGCVSQLDSVMALLQPDGAKVKHHRDFSAGKTTARHLAKGYRTLADFLSADKKSSLVG